MHIRPLFPAALLLLAPPAFAGNILVTDIANTPLPAVHITIDSPLPALPARDTSPDGKASLDPPPGSAEGFRITLTKPGFVPVNLTLGRPADPALSTLQLDKSATIGGRILEDDGSPIAGARVLVVAAKTYPSPAQTIPNRCATTDADGNWHLDGIPADVHTLTLYPFHPAYNLPDHLLPARTVKSELFARQQVLHLSRGEPLLLTLRGLDGKPLKDALVSLASSSPTLAPPPLPVNPDGTLLLAFEKNAAPTLIVQAPHLALLAYRLPADPPAALTLDLKPGNPLICRVEDSAGKPIPNALVTPVSWSIAPGFLSLPTAFLTNNRGEFEWDAAPAEPLSFRITAPGFLVQPAAPMKSRADNRAPLTRQAPIRITVEDAATHSPVPDASLQEALLPAPSQPPLWLDAPDAPALRRLSPGTFELLETRSQPAVQFRAAATDYLPADSAPVPLDGKPHQLTLSLHRGQRFAGTLLLPDSSPVPNLRLRLLPEASAADEPSQTLDALLAPPTQKSLADQFTTTDASGRFSFPPQTGNPVLLAQAPAGYLVATLSSLKNTPLRLLPWATIQGTLRQGARTAAAGTWVTLRTAGDDPALPELSAAAKTDRLGHFVIDHAFAGPFTLSGPGAPLEAATAAPGKSLTLDLGGTGLTVTGTLQLPPNLPAKWTTNASASLEPPVPLPTVKLPADFLTATPAERDAFYDAWRKDPANKPFVDASNAASLARKKYILSVNPDATFRIDGLPAGAYRLSVTFSSGGSTVPFADVQYTLSVPPIPNGVSDEPLELGALPPGPLAGDRLTQPAPDFLFTRLDGKPLTLASLKGKTVLLYFWSTTSEPSHQAETAILSLFNTLGPAAGRTSTLEILGLSTDPDPAAAKAYVNAHTMPWTQAHIGPRSFPAQLYQLHSLPTFALISPSGTLLALSPHLQPLLPLVQKAFPTR